MQTTLDLEEIAHRAETVFEERIQALVAGEPPEAFLAIDIVSGDYEVGQEDLPTERTLKARRPNAIVYVRRVADDAAYYVGGGYQD